MRIAVFGGSFNPPHVAHAMVASWLRLTDRADEVWLLPAFHHAFDKALAPWDQRLAWTGALADALGPWARVEPIEAELPVPSYTIRTLDTLAGRCPEHRFSLVIGADVAAQLPLWRESDRLRAQYSLIIVGRQGCPPVAAAPDFPDVSSTDVRARLAAGERVDHLVPAAVLSQLGGWFSNGGGR